MILGAKKTILNYQKGEAEKTGIKSLKVSFNKAIGFFIEVKNSSLNKVPCNYKIKQNLATSARYVTDELIEAYHPAYITENDYRFIYDSRRTVLLELSVMKDGNELQGDNLTWELEKHLLKIQGLFGCILLHCKSK